MISESPPLIIDENITPDLVPILRSAGLKAYHINELKANQKQRILDDQIRKLAIQKGYVIVSKDDDFVKSYVDRKVPSKMIFVYNLDKKELLLSRMKEVAPSLEKLLETHDFIEINPKEMRFPFSD
jgi:predicted nuclease of predicted toxin-antitoxin system